MFTILDDEIRLLGDEVGVLIEGKIGEFVFSLVILLQFSCTIIRKKNQSNTKLVLSYFLL